MGSNFSGHSWGQMTEEKKTVKWEESDLEPPKINDFELTSEEKKFWVASLRGLIENSQPWNNLSTLKWEASKATVAKFPRLNKKS